MLHCIRQVVVTPDTIGLVYLVGTVRVNEQATPDCSLGLIFIRRPPCALSNTLSYILTYLYMFLVVGETGVPGGNLRRHGENMQTPHRKAWSLVGIEPGPSTFYCFLFVCLLSIVFVKDADMKRETGNGWRQSQFDSFEALGDGGFGWVFKARKKDLDKFFAIKEIKVLADLLHTNIVRYYNSPNSQVLFIQMELCDGGTLRSWIYEKNKESMGMSLVLCIFTPENIFFGQDGNVRIGDFGLVTQDHDEIVERTEDRGTPNYMAPEQVGVNYDRKVDVFALGLIFFELFWKIATAQERYLIWPDVRSQKLPEEFTGLSHIIKNMLNENPKARPEASTLTTELEKWKAECNADKGNQTI
uniref:Protein kinase domain-containing protein n=1 Tax=Neogobius melanostomus TaxID=47308 RepID=A0A8C6WKJ6_9GOBI